MTWVEVLAVAAVVVGTVGYVLGLRSTRHNDEAERGLLLWVVLAGLGVATLVVLRTG